MKKIIFLSLFLFLSSCGNSSEIQQAKQEILNSNQTQESLSNSWATLQSGTGAQEESLPLGNSVEIRSLWENSYLSFDPLDAASLNSGEVSFRGMAAEGVEKIIVTFENTTSKFPRDQYTLQNFKLGDSKFSYLASSRFQVLDYGTNIYTFTAYKGKEFTQTEIEVFIAAEALPEKVEISPDVQYDDKVLGTENTSIDIKLPSSTTYGNPISTSQTSLTYSNIEGFEIIKEDVSALSCENLSEVLQEKLATWFYWNNCRDFISVKEGEAKKALSFYVIRLEGQNYVYEKQYIDLLHWLRASIILEKGSWVDKDTIEAKNTELKERNTLFIQSQITDDLMKKIIVSE